MGTVAMACSAVPVSPTVLAHAWPRMAEHIRIQHRNVFRAGRNARAALSLQHSMLMRSGSSHMRPPLLLPAAWWQARTCKSQTAGAHFYPWKTRVWRVWSCTLEQIYASWGAMDGTAGRRGVLNRHQLQL